MRTSLARFTIQMDAFRGWSLEKLDIDRKHRARLFAVKVLNCITINDSERELECFMKIQADFASEDKE